MLRTWNVSVFKWLRDSPYVVNYFFSLPPIFLPTISSVNYNVFCGSERNSFNLLMVVCIKQLPLKQIKNESSS